MLPDRFGPTPPPPPPPRPKPTTPPRERHTPTDDDRTSTQASASASASASAPTFSPVMVQLADVRPQPIDWLWPQRIAIGKLTLIAGDPGLGKSFLTLDLASRVSRGCGWPDDEHRDGSTGSAAPAAAPGGVVLVNCEDDIADTIRPRLDAAGADVSRIAALQGVSFRDSDTGAEVHNSFTLRDMPMLERAIDTVSNCRLVVIDPISAFMGNTDSHNNADVRAALAPLARLAADRGLAVVAVTHLRKGEGAAIYRAMGSLAFTAAARAVWSVSRDPDDADRRLLLPVKNNLGQDATGLAYHLITTPLGVAQVCWEAQPVEMTADQAFAAQPSRTASPALDVAVEFLQQTLAAGPMPAGEVKQRAHAAGIAERTLTRARKEMGISTQPTSFGGEWLWSIRD